MRGIQKLWLFALLWLAVVHGTARAAENLSGVYTIKGQKGDIVLTLQQTPGGEVSGSLKGGTLSLVLKGFPRPDGSVLGTANTTAGEFASYFVASKQNGQLLLDLVQANADGDPDMTQASRIAFGTATGAAPTPSETTETSPATAPADTVAGTFAGSYEGNGLILDSRAAGNGYTGSITIGAQKMPFTATAVNGILHGTFEARGDRFDFQAQWRGQTLILSSGGTDYNLQKQNTAKNPLAAGNASKNPLAKPNSPAKPVSPPAAAKAPATPAKAPPRATPAARPTTTDTPAKLTGAPEGSVTWKEFKHPTGLALHYPPSWTAKDLGGALLLSPPDVKQVGGGPAEVFIVMASSAGALHSGDDPQLEQKIDEQATPLLAGFTRAGQTQPIRIGSAPGIVMAWEGTAQGYPARAQIYATVLKNYAVALLAISTKDQIKAERDATVKRIFESLVAGAGEKDPQVAGKWFLYSYKGSGTYGRETKSYMTLLPDGTALWGQQSEGSWSGKGTDSGGNTTWTAGTASQNNDADKGAWSAAGGQLIIAWGDGTTATWSYRVGGEAGGNRRLFLTGSKNKPDEWMEIR
jgi:hypothetical protein